MGWWKGINRAIGCPILVLPAVRVSQLTWLVWSHNGTGNLIAPAVPPAYKHWSRVAHPVASILMYTIPNPPTPLFHKFKWNEELSPNSLHLCVLSSNRRIELNL